MEQFEDILVEDLTTSFKSGLVLCAVINRYRPDLLDFHALKKEDIAQNNQLAFDILEKELGKKIFNILKNHFKICPITSVNLINFYKYIFPYKVNLIACGWL